MVDNSTKLNKKWNCYKQNVLAYSFKNYSIKYFIYFIKAHQKSSSVLKQNKYSH